MHAFLYVIFLTLFNIINMNNKRYRYTKGLPHLPTNITGETLGLSGTSGFASSAGVDLHKLLREHRNGRFNYVYDNRDVDGIYDKHRHYILDTIDNQLHVYKPNWLSKNFNSELYTFLAEIIANKRDDKINKILDE